MCVCVRAWGLTRSDLVWSFLVISDVAFVTAASVSGLTKGLLEGTRSSCRVCAKKHTRRQQPSPSLHSWVRYLRQRTAEGIIDGCWATVPSVPLALLSPVSATQHKSNGITGWDVASIRRRYVRKDTDLLARMRCPADTHIPLLKVLL